MVARAHGRLVVSGLAALALMASVHGCGTDTTDTADPEPTASASESSSASTSPSVAPTQTPSQSVSATASQTPTKTPAPTPTSTPTPTPTSATSPTLPAGSVALRDRLLKAKELPGFNPEFTWRRGKTRSGEGQKLFGTCQKFALTSIGASSVVSRGYRPQTPGSAATAGHLVAQFPDAATARRAYAVLKSWRDQCADQLDRDGLDVGKLIPVPLASGAVGDWYLVSYPKAGDDAVFDAQGFTMRGRRIAMLKMRLVGQDYNYSSGKEPMVAAVRNAAVKLG